MALKDNLLLEKLYTFRQELRTLYPEKTICSDEALMSISDLKPLKVSDFNAISGLDHDFIDLFGSLFLKVIVEYQGKNPPVKLSKDAFKVLDHYKDRLSNISKTNPNLYMGRIDKNRSFDLTTLEDKKSLEYFITSKQKDLPLKNLTDYQITHLTTLYREINKDQKETGSYDLYIGYPYVEGIFKKDLFHIKAPLAYMPVKLNRTRKSFTLEKDFNKDIILNRDLLLAISKMEKTNVDQDMPPIESLSLKHIKEIILPVYAKYGLDIHLDQLSFIPFESLLKEDFSKRKKGQFDYKPYITFGRYKLYSSMIQKDMAKIMSMNKYNDLLEGLIDEKHLFQKELPIPLKTQQSSINESNIAYINDLNYSQEQVIELSNSEKKIVIWGPPGTGKSQVITSLIASAVLKGENVLVISEKKVALDVIYARLNDKKKYALFIDDASNKQAFYDQLSHFIDQNPPKRTLNNDAYKLEEQIKSVSQTFDKSLNLFYEEKVDGIYIYELFERYLKDKEIKPDLKPKDVLTLFQTKLFRPSFLDINYLEQTFDKDTKLKTLIDYQKMIQTYPWFKKLETKISRSSKLEYEQFKQALEQAIIHYQKNHFFKKRRIKKAFFKEQFDALNFLTKKKGIKKQLLTALFFDTDFKTYLDDQLMKLNKIKTNHIALNKLAMSYIDLFIHEPKLKDAEAYKLRRYLFDAFYTGFLENYKAKHQKYLYILEDYQKYANQINDDMRLKQQVSKESFEMVLYQHALHFSNTKRIMDIKRILESDQKPSVKAFIDHFYPEIIKHIKVFLMTPEVISAILPLETQMFDLVIFDEASQLYVEKGIPAIYRAKKVVIAGDPKQLRPSALGIGRLEEEDYLDDDILKDVTLDAKSLLDLARYRYKETLLNFHYRSQYEELIAFSNHAFYDGKLIVSPNVKKPLTPPIEYVYVPDGKFINKKNIAEAEAVIKLLKKIVKEKAENESVGIITFNSTQRDLILNLLDEATYKKSVYQKPLETEISRVSANGDESLFVKNIENVQGDERDIIIFSMGYGHDETGVVRRRFGWLNHEGGQNRLNVAITRAKKKIYFVSSLYPESFKVDDLAGVGPKLLKDFMRYCYYVSNKNDDMTKTVLASLHDKASDTDQHVQSKLVLDLKDRLEKSGYSVETNLGIGGFNLDLAILDPENHTYKLGIICSLSNQKQIQSRLELIHQDKYLKSRGWSIYHVFHSNYYEDPTKEIKVIKSLVNV